MRCARRCGGVRTALLRLSLLARVDVDGARAQTHTLTVVNIGGAVASDPAGIDCGSDCAEEVASGTVATVTPTASPGFAFVGWGGDNDCTNEERWAPGSTLAWSQNDTDAGTLMYRLYLDNAAQGTLDNVVCDASVPAACTASFPAGFAPAVGAYLMQLRAERASVVSALSSGADASVGGGTAEFPTRVTMSENRSCVATFDISAQPFTDDPLVAGATAIKVVHFHELRARIDTQRASYGLATVSWTDNPLVAGATAVRAVHVIEMRTALDQAYTAAAMATPTHTDPGLGAGTMIKAMHISELRAFVAALE